MAMKQIPLTVTAEQAATGTDLHVPFAGQTHTFRIPPCSEGDLIPAYVAGQEVRLRVIIVKDRSLSPRAQRFGRVLGITAGVIGVVLVVVTLVTMN
ncbi:hypothetical protein ACIBI4_33495 [Streptomyces sp. NPDC050418]|uniref:hypothetical protein n=1 Tax=Streptomyces sp. NPDC050418 TaxID=3365612 RepID=UPI0037ADB673